MARPPAGSNARRRKLEAEEEGSGLIDLNTLMQLDRNGDPVSGLQRRAAVGSLQAPPQAGGHHSRTVAIATVVAAAMIGAAAVVSALYLRGGTQEVVIQSPAVAPAPAAAVKPAPAAAVKPPPPAASAQAAQPAAPAPEAKPVAVAAPEPADKPRAAVRTERKTDEAQRDLPPKPSRESILAAMNQVLPQMRECGGEGVAKIDMVIHGPRGKVRSASVSGAEGSVARCLTTAAKGARFEPFADTRFKIRYPVRL